MTVSAGRTVRMPVAGVQVGESGGLQEKGGLRLRSDRPVTVAQIQSDDVNRDAQSSGGTMLLPVHVLGTHYMVMTYPQKQTPEIASLTGSPSGAGRLLDRRNTAGDHGDAETVADFVRRGLRDTVGTAAPGRATRRSRSATARSSRS